jgi:hypothetical protein
MGSRYGGAWSLTKRLRHGESQKNIIFETKNVFFPYTVKRVSLIFGLASPGFFRSVDRVTESCSVAQKL